MPVGLVFEYIPGGKLKAVQRLRIRQLSLECFSKVPQREIDEDFIARARGYVFASDPDGSIVGKIDVYCRKVELEGRRITLGGLGGTCVMLSARHKGLGSQLVAEGMKILKEIGCDIACLSANIREFPSGGMYRKFGFRLRRTVIYSNVRGEVKDIEDEFFAPVCSPEAYEFVMKSKTTFNLGKGYW